MPPDKTPTSIDRLQTVVDQVQMTFPLVPLGLVVVFEPPLHGGNGADDLFLADLHHTAEALVRRPIVPGGPDQWFTAQQNTEAAGPRMSLLTL